jgi:hypothetical protein
VHSTSVVTEDYEEGRSNCESRVQPESSELRGRKKYLSKKSAFCKCSG